MNTINPLLYTDGYKLDHRRQYPEKTTRVYSNWTARSGRIPVAGSIFFGLQYFLQKYMMYSMNEAFFSRPREDVEKEYELMLEKYLGPNDVGSSHIAALHELGYVPLEFRALPEGTFCVYGIPMVTVENTHDDFSWLVNYFETLMSSILWLPCTSATQAARLRRLLDAMAKVTGADLEFVQWQGHDFSMRGMCGTEAAVMSGAGHLLSFTGTDTVPVLDFVRAYYPDPEEGLIGGSVFATEHSVMSAGGHMTEMQTFERILDLYPTGIVSVVSDTWDLWNVISGILPKIKDRIMSRDGKLVIRPDSGDPVNILCGDPEAEKGSLAHKGVVEALWDLFGGTVNEQGFKQLDPHIGVIYGDAITYDRAEKICHNLINKNFSSANVVLGVGSYTYQYVTRDTLGFAMKSTWAKVDGKDTPLFKKPITDTGEKFSAKGRLSVVREDGDLKLIQEATPEQEAESLLTPVWKDGAFEKTFTFSEVRNTLRECLTP
jgi:nicotinamide phosphoribosyltransferase